MAFSIWLRCPDCGHGSAERPWQYTGELSAAGELLPYRLGWWVTRCVSVGCPTSPVLTAPPEAVDAWLAAEPQRGWWPDEDDDRYSAAHEAWTEGHPFTVEFQAGQP